MTALASLPRRRPQDGFSLIESLVALAILALTAVALLGATEAHIARIGGLEARATSDWIAQNHLALRQLGQTEPGEGEMLGLRFSVKDQESPTSDPDVVTIAVTVTDIADGRVYGGTTGFLDRGLDK